MLNILKRLIERYRAWRRAGQAWSNGRRVTMTEAIEDVQRY